MPFLNWSENLSVKIPSIDTQHKELLRMLNELFDAMQQGQGKVVMGKVLDGLIGYTATHFATEEKLFDRHDYPDSEAHKQQHKKLVEKVNAFHEAFQAGNTKVSAELMQFLKEWLMNHILGADKLYSGFLVKRGEQ
jgi:hemerythrin-like metal-binding protein